MPDMKKAIVYMATLFALMFIGACGGGGGSSSVGPAVGSSPLAPALANSPAGPTANSAGVPTAQINSGSAVTVSWTAPATDIAGNTASPAGYRVYHGTQPGVYTDMTDVGNNLSVTYTSLQAGKTHYFAVSAYDSSGVESSLSNPTSVTL